VCPLTRSRDDIPQLAERWDLVAFGMEIATAYSELNDPVEQRRRLEQQSLLAAGGDPEAMVVDEQFLQAMEFGMPPTGGIGIGIDRLLMLLSGQSIRTTLAFPLVRPGTATDGS
jgi:lysyl-tRNA synthetase class 2